MVLLVALALILAGAVYVCDHEVTLPTVTAIAVGRVVFCAGVFAVFASAIYLSWKSYALRACDDDDDIPDNGRCPWWTAPVVILVVGAALMLAVLAVWARLDPMFLAINVYS